MSNKVEATHWDASVLERLYGPRKLDRLSNGLWRTHDFPVLQTADGTLDLTTEAIERFYRSLAQGETQ